MSASLVGSEMCIRDRTTTPSATTTTTTNDDDCGNNKKINGNSGKQAKTACLLYTSDAADDM
eukprot:2510154-Alexandrium_andersonii.AAC.1